LPAANVVPILPVTGPSDLNQTVRCARRYCDAERLTHIYLQVVRVRILGVHRVGHRTNFYDRNDCAVCVHSTVTCPHAVTIDALGSDRAFNFLCRVLENCSDLLLPVLFVEQQHQPGNAAKRAVEAEVPPRRVCVRARTSIEPVESTRSRASFRRHPPAFSRDRPIAPLTEGRLFALSAG